MSPDKTPPKYPFIEVTPKGLYLRLKIQPRASKNQISGTGGPALKIRLTAPPVEGEANRAVIEFLSELLSIKKSSLIIVSGLKSRDKRVKVEGITLGELERAFERTFL